MKKKNYRVFIIDVDGTLYYQLPVRICMAIVLGCYYLVHLCRLKDLLMLYDFRKVRERYKFVSNDLEKEQYRIIADKWKVSEEYVKVLIDRWMQQYPMKLVKWFRDRRLIDVINKLHKIEKVVVVYSDYPAKKKAKILGLRSDYIFSSVDHEIGYLKPDKRSMENIMRIVGCKPEECLMIGDRMEKDGKAAENVGMDYFILKQSSIWRRKIGVYDKIWGRIL